MEIWQGKMITIEKGINKININDNKKIHEFFYDYYIWKLDKISFYILEKPKYQISFFHEEPKKNYNYSNDEATIWDLKENNYFSSEV